MFPALLPSEEDETVGEGGGILIALSEAAEAWVSICMLGWGSRDFDMLYSAGVVISKNGCGVGEVLGINLAVNYL